MAKKKGGRKTNTALPINYSTHTESRFRYDAIASEEPEAATVSESEAEPQPSISPKPLIQPMPPCPTSSEILDKEKNELIQGLASLLESEKHADITISVSHRFAPERQFRAHLAILSLRTSYFDSSTTGTHHFSNICTPFAMSRVLQYIYTGDYSAESIGCEMVAYESADISKIVRHLDVYALADLLDIPSLKALSHFKIFEQIAEDGTTILDAIHTVYGAANEEHGRKKAVVELVYTNIRTLNDNEDFRRLLRENANFSADLIQVMLKNEI